MRPAGSGVKLTYDDYVLFPDDGQRHEFDRREPLRDAVTELFDINRFLATCFYYSGHGSSSTRLDRFYYAPLDVVLSTFDIVEPDLLYLSNERAAKVVHAAACARRVQKSWSRLPRRAPDAATRRPSAASTSVPASRSTGSSIARPTALRPHGRCGQRRYSGSTTQYSVTPARS